MHVTNGRVKSHGLRDASVAKPSRKPSRLTAQEALKLGVDRLLRAGVDSAQLDMGLILAESLGTDRLHLYMDLDRPLTPIEQETARRMLARRLHREPMAHILGRRDFYDLTLEVTPGVLVPRPETELLVGRAIERLKAQNAPDVRLADVGTGTGAIAVAVARHCPRSRWIATDCSEEALCVARRNAERHGVSDRIDFQRTDLLEGIEDHLDAVLANPPYVAEGDRASVAPEIARWEPPEALFAGPDGLSVIRRLIHQAHARISPGGWLLLECGAGQAPRIRHLLAETGAWDDLTTHRDLAGHERVIEATRRA